jgi:hypothetical protein
VVQRQARKVWMESAATALIVTGIAVAAASLR